MEALLINDKVVIAEVAKWLKAEKGILPSDSFRDEKEIDSYTDKDSKIGLLKKIPVKDGGVFYFLEWLFSFDYKEKEFEFIGFLDLKGDSWKINLYGRENMEFGKSLAYDLNLKFNKNIEIDLVKESSKTEEGDGLFFTVTKAEFVD